MNMILRLVIFIGIFALLEFYAFTAVKTVFRDKWIWYLYGIVSICAFVLIVYGFLKFDRSVGQTQQTLFTAGLLLFFLIPKIVIALPLLIEDIFRIMKGCVYFFTGDNSPEGFLPERRKFVSQVALALAAIPFSALLYGVTKGKYNFKVLKQRLEFPDLPEAFDGFKILQISDIHSGSFDDKEKIEYAINLINEQEADIFLFTGDIVNSLATEMHPWIDTFKNIKPFKFGKYSILGNHDYGEYLQWSSDAARKENFEAIKDLHRQIGFDLMLNQHKWLEKGNQKIALIGVENWGHNFKQKGDINKASEGITETDFKIVMSHDPSHWDMILKNHPKHFQLTLSGHTHGFQFGIEIPGIKWSPVQYVYKQWAGMYENFGRYINVNRGFGFHAYPGRIGIWPEITVIELKKSQKTA